jgi:hypothetical protein
MSQLTDAQLLAESQAIQNQTVAGANTAPVVGGVFVDLTQSKINNDKVVTNITGASDINIPSEKAVYNKLLNKQDALGYIPEDTADKSTDGTLSANSDTLYPSQKAVKTYVNSTVASNDLDAVLTNGNFSSQQANVGAIGLIGATSGFTGEITQDDYHFDFDTNIGKSFQIEHGAITMSNVTGINNNTSLSLVASNITSQKTQNFPNKNGTFAMTSDLAAYELLANKSIDATLSANSDTLYPSQKAVKTYVDAHSGGASYVPAISVTYSALSSLIAAGSLVQGQKYLINDYRTVHQILNTSTINTGNLEPLIVTAATSNTLSPVAISTTFPKDIIWYNFTSDQNAIPGCTKGYIYRRIDTIQNNDIPFDFRNVKFRRWQINVTTQDTTGAVGTYTKGAVVKKTSTNEVYVKLTNNSGVFSNTNFWTRLSFDNLSYISPTQTEWEIVNDFYTLIIPCSSLFQDYKMWSVDSYYNTATNNTINSVQSGNWIGGNLALYNTVIYGTYFERNNIGPFFYNNSIREGFVNNKIEDSFYNNLIGENFYNNIIDNYFYGNVISAFFGNNVLNQCFYSNTLSSSFNTNMIQQGFNNNSVAEVFQNNNILIGFTFNTIGNNFIKNKIGQNFYNNKIGMYFKDNNILSSFQANTIDDYFQNNLIGEMCYSNTIGQNFKHNFGLDLCALNTIGQNFDGNTFGTNFSSCTIGNDFKNNTIASYFYGNIILSNFQYNLTIGTINNKNPTLTHVYQPYSCTIGSSVNGTTALPYVQYVNSSYVSQTAILS